MLASGLPGGSLRVIPLSEGGHRLINAGGQGAAFGRCPRIMPDVMLVNIIGELRATSPDEIAACLHLISSVHGGLISRNCRGRDGQARPHTHGLALSSKRL